MCKWRKQFVPPVLTLPDYSLYLFHTEDIASALLQGFIYVGDQMIIFCYTVVDT